MLNASLWMLLKVEIPRYSPQCINKSFETLPTTAFVCVCVGFWIPTWKQPQEMTARWELCSSALVAASDEAGGGGGGGGDSGRGLRLITGTPTKGSSAASARSLLTFSGCPTDESLAHCFWVCIRDCHEFLDRLLHLLGMGLHLRFSGGGDENVMGGESSRSLLVVSDEVGKCGLICLYCSETPLVSFPEAWHWHLNTYIN